MAQRSNRRTILKGAGAVAIASAAAVISGSAIGRSPVQATATTAPILGCFSFDDRVAVVPENFTSVTRHFAVAATSMPWNSSGRIKFPIALRTDSRIEITVQSTHGSPGLLYGYPHDPPVSRLIFGPCNIVDTKRLWGVKVGAIQVQRPGCVELSVKSATGANKPTKRTVAVSVGSRCPAKQRR